MRIWFRTRPNSYFDDGIAKLPIRCEKRYNRETNVYSILFTAPTNVPKQNSGSYLIRPRTIIGGRNREDGKMVPGRPVIHFVRGAAGPATA